MILKKKVPVVNFIVNYGVDQPICLTTQNSWSTTLQHSGQLGSPTNLAHKHHLSLSPTTKHVNACFSEVGLGTHDSWFFLYLKHIDHDGEPKDFFTQGQWGELPQRKYSTPCMEYLKDSLDTGQTEDGFFNSK